MLFNSLHYLIFFPLVVVAYFLLPHRFRWVLLLGASVYFYMVWRPFYIVLILFSATVDFWASRQMERKETRKERRPFLWISLISNLGLLFTFKYYDFFITEVGKLLAAMGMDYTVPALKWVLPMGISFYTFQTLSYTLDVYKGQLKAERHFGIFSLFVTFFPQLVAGPIERASHLLPQFREKHSFDYDETVLALNKIFYGLFKKVVVADRLGEYVTEVYSEPGRAGSVAVWIATVFFAIQIYCDFSGYSDIAIGSARIMGFRLMENFRRPYLSQSVAEFWRRWHISLSTWFRDYVYIPLGGNRVVKWRWYYNVLITFAISGIWHGAEWTFLVWGALHGGYMVFALITERFRNRVARLAGLVPGRKVNTLANVLVTLLLVCIAWVFFRAENMEDAMLLLKKAAFFDFHFGLTAIVGKAGTFNFLLCLFVAFLLLVSYMLPYDLRLRYPKLFILTVIALMLFLGSDGKEFIYFQF